MPVDFVAPRLARIAGLEDETGDCRIDLIDRGHGIAERDAPCDERRSEGGAAQPVGAGQTRRGEHAVAWRREIDMERAARLRQGAVLASTPVTASTPR
ncbi:hypothetical protein GCM10011393_14700 [Sphingopyxis bauzanensis]|nr:hypothetical protein GCM10011393_14700 [Sphingopyxis bauzanensis]